MQANSAILADIRGGFGRIVSVDFATMECCICKRGNLYVFWFAKDRQPSDVFVRHMCDKLTFYSDEELGSIDIVYYVWNSFNDIVACLDKNFRSDPDQF